MKKNNKTMKVIVFAMAFALMFSTAGIVNAGITASGHWNLTAKQDGGKNWYSGAEGYTTAKAKHRTTIKHYVCTFYAKKGVKWGTGKVSKSTGYDKRHTANMRQGSFKSAVYYYFK